MKPRKQWNTVLYKGNLKFQCWRLPLWRNTGQSNGFIDWHVAGNQHVVYFTYLLYCILIYISQYFWIWIWIIRQRAFRQKLDRKERAGGILVPLVHGCSETVNCLCMHDTIVQVVPINYCFWKERIFEEFNFTVIWFKALLFVCSVDFQ